MSFVDMFMRMYDRKRMSDDDRSGCISLSVRIKSGFADSKFMIKLSRSLLVLSSCLRCCTSV